MKKLSLIVGMFFVAGSAFSQSFMHGAGITAFIATAKGGSAAVNGGFTYSPRVNFIEQEDMSVSIGIPLSIGLSGSANASYNSRTGSSGSNSLAVMLDAPLIVSLNLGAGSTKDTESRFGYFVGAGFGYHYGTFNVSDVLSFEEDVKTKFSAYGPAGNAGIRFGVGSDTHNIEVKVSYMKGINTTKANVFGIGAAFNF